MLEPSYTSKVNEGPWCKLIAYRGKIPGEAARHIAICRTILYRYRLISRRTLTSSRTDTLCTPLDGLLIFYPTGHSLDSTFWIRPVHGEHARQGCQAEWPVFDVVSPFSRPRFHLLVIIGCYRVSAHLVVELLEELFCVCTSCLAEVDYTIKSTCLEEVCVYPLKRLDGRNENNSSLISMCTLEGLEEYLLRNVFGSNGAVSCLTHTGSPFFSRNQCRAPASGKPLFNSLASTRRCSLLILLRPLFEVLEGKARNVYLSASGQTPSVISQEE